MKRALLFDLDETLLVEEPAAAAAFAVTARHAASRYEIDPLQLAVAARSRARELW
jgi:putative hydrolase of the HAD superfamily